MEFKRQAYLDRLISSQRNGFIKVITGQRRVGKTYLLKTLFYNYLISSGIDKDHIIYLSFDGIKKEQLRDPVAFFDLIQSKIIDNNLYYILLDEIQLLDKFVDVLNELKNIDNVEIYVTGSNSHLLSSDIDTQFRGRGWEIHLLPLDLNEILDMYPSFSEAYDKYTLYGGLPIVHLQESNISKELMLKSIYKETLINDIKDRYKIQHLKEFEDIALYIASQIGDITSNEKISNTFKSKERVTISKTTVNKYINYLLDAFLISKSDRYDIRGKKFLGVSYKYYYEDLGLRNAALSFLNNNDAQLLENLIYNELRSRLFTVSTGVIPQSFINKEGKCEKKYYEIDFLATLGNFKAYIQVAQGIDVYGKDKQELEPLRKIPDSFKKFLILKEYKNPRYNEDGITIVGLEQFLTNPNILLNS